MEQGVEYIGEEIELFQYAVNWKNYFASFFQTYIHGAVVEVGAGTGANVPYLLNPSVTNYYCIEPDNRLASVIADKIFSGRLPKICTVKQGFLEDGLENIFDTILYVDVLEHIQNDWGEIEKAARALKSRGYLCILVPANPKDFTAFDKAIGHFRRYTKAMLVERIPAPLQIEWCHYLDSVGSLASKVNKLFLKQSQPTKKQVLIWDKLMVPVSKIMDKAMGFNYGKSLLLVAKKRD